MKTYLKLQNISYSMYCNTAMDNDNYTIGPALALVLPVNINPIFVYYAMYAIMHVVDDILNK